MLSFTLVKVGPYVEVSRNREINKVGPNKWGAKLNCGPRKEEAGIRTRNACGNGPI